MSANCNIHLTTREAQVLALICLGLGSDQIARRLRVGKRTVDFHMVNLHVKAQGVRVGGASSADTADRSNRILMIHALGFWGLAESDLLRVAATGNADAVRELRRAA